MQTIVIYESKKNKNIIAGRVFFFFLAQSEVESLV